MVSLATDSPRSGGFFFDDRSQSQQGSDDLILDVSTNNFMEIEVHKIRTPWMIVCSIILVVGYEVAVFVIPWQYDNPPGGPSPLAIILYSQGALWFWFLLADRYYRQQHYASRTHGYLEFYRRTRHVRRIPILIFSGGTAAVLVIYTALQEYCGPYTKKDMCGDLPISKNNFLQILVSGELAVILPILIIYLVRTVRFNQANQVPDIHLEDSMTAFIQTHNSSSSLGFRDDPCADDLVEKQADLIRYLQQHNTHLSQKIVTLTEQMNNGRT